MQAGEVFGQDPGARNRWVRRRYVVEGGLILPLVQSPVREYSPNAPRLEWDEDGRQTERDDLFPEDGYSRLSIVTELANLDAALPRAVEEFATRWGLLGLAMHDGREAPDETWDTRYESLEEFSAAVGEFKQAVDLGAEWEATKSDETAAQLLPMLRKHVRRVGMVVGYVGAAAAAEEAALVRASLRRSSVYVTPDEAAPIPGIGYVDVSQAKPIPGIDYLDTGRVASTAAPGITGHWSLEWSFTSLLSCAYFKLYGSVSGGRAPERCANPTCGRWFMPTRSDRLYCSTRCTSTVRQRERRQALRKQKTADAE